MSDTIKPKAIDWHRKNPSAFFDNRSGCNIYLPWGRMGHYGPSAFFDNRSGCN